jgi:hypothetical protein
MILLGLPGKPRLFVDRLGAPAAFRKETKMRIHRLARISIFAAVFCCAVRAAQADDANLLSRIPPGANAVAIIDVDKILNSPMGIKEKWKDKLKNAYASKPLMVPPSARRLVLAALIDPSTMQPAWEVSVMEMKTAPSMKSIAKAEGGFADTISEKQAVWSPINAYFIRLDTQLLGTVAPANRQFTARWARRGASQGDNLSPYLQRATASIDDNTSYLFAMDLEDATSLGKVRRRIDMGDFESVADKTENAAKIASVVASIKGISLRVSIGKEPVGSGIIEFGRPTAVLADFAKPLLLEVLGKFGASIDGLDTWKVTATGNNLTLSGKLPVEGLQQLLSIVDPPSPLPTADSDDETGTANSSNEAPKSDTAVAAASQQYFAAIAKIIDNTGKKIRTSTSMTQGAKWVAGDARRIARLPIVNVDPDLVNWGTDVCARLNDLASAVGVGGLQARSRAVGIQDANVIGTHSEELEIRSDPNDRINQQNVKRQRLAASAEQKAQTAQVATRMLADIEQTRSQIRSAMVAKYNVNF